MGYPSFYLVLDLIRGSWLFNFPTKNDISNPEKLMAMMSRVENGRITKPNGGGGGGITTRKRGRPAINWTPSRKRRLLRLYLCTPESELSLIDILRILSDDQFCPKPRKTQCLLSGLLDRSYRRRRPRNRPCMQERLTYLRSIRDGQPHEWMSSVRPEIVSDCSILLDPKPEERKEESCSPHQTSWLDIQPEPLTPEAGPSGSGSGTWFSDGFPSPRLTAAAGEFPPMTEDLEAFEPSPRRFKRSRSIDDNERRRNRIESLRIKLPGRSSSFLADVASLLSGLSVCSSPASSRRSSRRPSGRKKRAGSLLSRGEPESPSVQQGMKDDVDHFSSAFTQIQSTTHNTPTRENEELVKFCCSKRSYCLHKRISAVLAQSRPAEGFVCTEGEVNEQDGLGNTALHFAARCGAPEPVLAKIMALMRDLNTTNKQHETFLHVLDPAKLDIGEGTKLIKHLELRGFNFWQLDSAGRTFAERLLARSSCSVEWLEEAVFSHLCEADRLFLLRHRSGSASSPRQHQQHHLNPNFIGLVREKLLLSHQQSVAMMIMMGGGTVDEEDNAAQIEAVDTYCEYFSSRYDTEYHTTWIKPSSLFCHVPVNTQGRNSLHQLVASLNVGTTLCPPTNEDLCGLYPAPATGPPEERGRSRSRSKSPSSSNNNSAGSLAPSFLAFSQVLAVTLDNISSCHTSPSSSSVVLGMATTNANPSNSSAALLFEADVNNREQGTNRTPLMTMLRGFAWGNYSGQAMVELLAMLVSHGARPELTDADGNNALHHAAELGLLRPVVFLCHYQHRSHSPSFYDENGYAQFGDGFGTGGGPDLKNMVNNRGETPLDLAVRRMTEYRHYVPQTEAVMRTARHAEVVRFLCTGEVAEW